MGKRELYITLDDDKSKSNKCKSLCIDKKLKYCAGQDFMEGNCCDKKKDPVCPKGKTTFDPRFNMEENWCSDRNPKAPISFKYLLCPNEVACGDNGSKFIMPAMSGELLTREIDKFNPV